MTKKILFSLLFFTCTFNLKSQDDNGLYNNYEIVYEYLNSMLSGDIPLNFKNAVFFSLYAYFENNIDINSFNDGIKSLTNIVKMLLNYDLIHYTGKDKSEIIKHAAIFKVLTDSVPIIIDSVTTLVHLPYVYDFDDSYGHADWTKTFVSKLMLTGKGNCHSLPYLYKILADETGAKCHLAFAPNHIYIKVHSQTRGWYNTELTSATFPVDAWIIASGYVSVDAIRSGLYMDTLSNRQAVANCLLDLAQGYQHKYGKENPEFVVKCCNTVLQYHPTSVNAMLTKAEAQKTYIQKQMKQKNAKKVSDLFTDAAIKTMYAEMEQIYAQLHDSGYRRMPEEMYLQWLGLPKLEPEKYTE
jgi:hypothetical protein